MTIPYTLGIPTGNDTITFKNVPDLKLELTVETYDDGNDEYLRNKNNYLYYIPGAEDKGNHGENKVFLGERYGENCYLDKEERAADLRSNDVVRIANATRGDEELIKTEIDHEINDLKEFFKGKWTMQMMYITPTDGSGKELVDEPSDLSIVRSDDNDAKLDAVNNLIESALVDAGYDPETIEKKAPSGPKGPGE